MLNTSEDIIETKKEELLKRLDKSIEYIKASLEAEQKKSERLANVHHQLGLTLYELISAESAIENYQNKDKVCPEHITQWQGKIKAAYHYAKEAKIALETEKHDLFVYLLTLSDLMCKESEAIKYKFAELVEKFHLLADKANKIVELARAEQTDAAKQNYKSLLVDLKKVKLPHS